VEATTYMREEYIIIISLSQYIALVSIDFYRINVVFPYQRLLSHKNKFEPFVERKAKRNIYYDPMGSNFESGGTSKRLWENKG